MRIVLLYPPDRNFPSNPYSSLPALTGCLRAEGHTVFQHDINLEVFEYLTSKGRLLPWYDRDHERMTEMGLRNALNAEQAEEYRALVRRLAVSRASLERVDTARGELKDTDSFFTPARFNRNFDDAREAMRFYFGDFLLDNATQPDLVDRLFSMLAEPLEDPVSGALDDAILDGILAHEPDMIGVTIPFMVAYWESMKLIKKLRQRAPHVKIVVGGALTRNNESIFTADPRMFDLYDFLIDGDGDRALPELVRTVETGGDLSQVPNLYYRESGGKVNFTFEESIKDLNALPTPDFMGLPLDRYPIPHVGATFQTSRGCYYGKCTFCSESYWKDYRLRKPELIVEDMIKIYNSTGIRHFYFWDPLCPPKTLKYVAQQVKERNLPFIWFAETKMEKSYLPPTYMRDLYAGGCRFLQFGFESASQRVLNLIDKDNYLPEVDQILTNMHEAGVMACMTWFIGFPTETESEGKLTYDYMRLLGSRLGLNVYSGIYYMHPDQPLFHKQEELGIQVTRDQYGGYTYTYEDGSSPYDKLEQHHTYESRTDSPILRHGGYLLYAERNPEKLAEICGGRRTGPVTRHVRDLEHARVVRSDAAVLQRFPRDTELDFTQQAQSFILAHHTVSGESFRLRGREVAALLESDQTLETEMLRKKLGVEWPEMEDILTRLTNRGLLKFVGEEEVIQIDSATAHYAGSEYLVECGTLSAK